MRRILLTAILFAGILSLNAQEQKEVVTGEGYANDVYYSLESGTVATVTRNTWDLGFTTSKFSISILANHAAGVEVYTYPAGDTSNWADLDTTGMAWQALYNSIETRDEGAFSANATGHPDYGWGTYNMITHNITGDSLYVIKTMGGNYKKLAIVLRQSTANLWDFKYANLDGSEEQVVSLNAEEYISKSFVFYSLDSNTIVDQEPATGEFDLIFTRYWDYTIPYFVTGVLTNEAHIEVQEVKHDGLDQATFVDYTEESFGSNISTIGSDWKSFNMATFTYDLATDVVYFLKKSVESDSSYFKIYFTGFSGSTEGKYTFMQEQLTAVSAPGKLASGILMEVYPNPASAQLHVVFDFTGDTHMEILDMAGRMVTGSFLQGAGFGQVALDVTGLEPGLYFLRASHNGTSEVVRFIKQ
jgi:hypothetical protein